MYDREKLGFTPIGFKPVCCATWRIAAFVAARGSPVARIGSESLAIEKREHSAALL